jgi:hypothetical protein
MTYNALMFGTAWLLDLSRDWPRWAVPFYQPSPDAIIYHWPVVLLCALGALVPLVWLHRLPYQATREEEIHEARARQPHHPLTVSAE